jgi:ABC-type Fe3+/spermidine/putrescine transport system ATPase subunit
VGNGADARFTAGGVEIAVSEPRTPPGAATLALRPHKLRLVAAGAGRLDGRCQRVDYLGSHIEYLIASPWGELLVFGPVTPDAPRAGSSVGLDFDTADAVVLPG